MRVKKGWFNESRRHSLASRGIRTTVHSEGLRQLNELSPSLKKPVKNKQHGSYLIDQPRFTWSSVYDAPVSLIQRDFKENYGREPTDEELNDILLQGRY